MNTRPPMHHWRRRQFFQFTAGGSIAWLLAACAPSPLITPPAGSTPMAAPTLDDDRRSGARAAAGLAELARGCAAIPGVDAAFSNWCTALSDQHHAHLVVLSQADPLGGVQSDHTPLEQITAAPQTTPHTQTEAMAVLAAEEARVADLLTPMVTNAEQSPSMALLWLSQRLAAQVAARALEGGTLEALGPAPVTGAAVPAEFEAGDAKAARQVLLSHQRALVFGLQAVLGRIAHNDPAVNAVESRLGEAMRERDQTAAAITASGGTPEPPAPDYTLPGDATDPSQRDLIWGRLELAVLDGWARVAAVDPVEREVAAAQALVQAGRSRALGQQLPFWPGWV